MVYNLLISSLLEKGKTTGRWWHKIHGPDERSFKVAELPGKKIIAVDFGLNNFTLRRDRFEIGMPC